MKSDPKSPRSSAETQRLKEKAARQLKDSEEAAKEVSDLCEKAAEKARQLHIPHAGVGLTEPAEE